MKPLESNGHAALARPDPPPADALALLPEAEALRAALAEATVRAGRLVVALKHRQREQNALTQAWSILKALNLAPTAREETTLMDTVLTDPLRRLARALTDLRGPARRAVTGEVARAVGEAAREAVAFALTVPRILSTVPPRTSLPPRAAAGRPGDPPSHPRWDDNPDDGFDGPAPGITESESRCPPAAALAAGWAAARWWVGRGGSVPAAAAVGTAVALGVAAGGPTGRAGAAVLAAAADLGAVAAALGAARPARD